MWFIQTILIPFLACPPILGLFLGGCCCAAGVDCSFCNSGTSPLQIQVTLTGIANNVCMSCASYNGTFVLDQNPFVPCSYVYTFPSKFCGSATDIIRLTFTSFGPLVETVADASAIVRFFKPITTPFDCTTFSLTNIPYLESTNCDGGSATCTMTSL